MKKLIQILFLLFLLATPVRFLLPLAKAQSGWQWGVGNRGGGIDAYCVATDHSGNVYGAGINFENDSTKFGSIAVPCLGGVSGWYFIPIQGVWVKYSPTGTPLWAGGTQNGDAYLFNITTDPCGNLIVFGAFDSDSITIGGTTIHNSSFSSTADNQYFIAKFSPSGSLLWVVHDGCTFNYYTQYLNTCFLSTGGVTADADGNIYITASFLKPSITIGSDTLTNTDASGHTNDIFIAKYSPAGTLIWTSKAGGISDEFAYGITATSSGKVYVSGAFYSSSFTIGSSTINNPYGGTGYSGGDTSGGKPSAYIAQFSSTGIPLWAQAAGGSHGAYALGIASDSLSNVYMTGGFGNTSISFGATTITRTFPAAAPNLALYLVQYSPSNIVTWSKTIGSSINGLWGLGVALDNCGDVWVSGNYSENANIDGDVLSGIGGSDPVFIAGYNLSTGVIGYAGLGSGGDDQNSIAIDPTGNIFICSDYYGTSLAVGSDTLSNTTGTGSEYLYIGKYAHTSGCTPTPGCTSAGNKEITLSPNNNFSLYPNPTTGDLNIRFDKDSYSTCIITNTLGQEVFSQAITVTTTNLDVKYLPEGLYYVVLKGTKGMSVQKFMKI